MEQDNKAQGLDGRGRVVKKKRGMGRKSVWYLLVNLLAKYHPDTLDFSTKKYPSNHFHQHYCWLTRSLQTGIAGRCHGLIRLLDGTITWTVTTGFDFATFELHKVAWFFLEIKHVIIFPPDFLTAGQIGENQAWKRSMRKKCSSSSLKPRCLNLPTSCSLNKSTNGCKVSTVQWRICIAKRTHMKLDNCEVGK